MELFKTFPAYSWLFIFANTEIYVKIVKIKSFDVWLIQGLTVQKLHKKHFDKKDFPYFKELYQNCL